MKNHLIIAAIGVIMAAGLVTPSWGFDIRGTKTRAKIETFVPSSTAIQLNFGGQFSDIGDLTPVGVVVTWRSAGGIEPPRSRSRSRPAAGYPTEAYMLWISDGVMSK